MAAQHGTIAHLLNTNYKGEITRWLAEDCPSFDYGGFVVGDEPKEAKLLCKSQGVLAGVPFFDEVFRQLDCTVEWHAKEGELLKPVYHAATVRGPARKLLLGERVALNTIARCSGIATRTRSTIELLNSHFPADTADASAATSTAAPGPKPPRLAGTRKTTPGFRVPEKYAMLVGGADAHRHDLSAMTMLKDNHVWACGGSIERAVAAARAAGGFAVKVEVECRSADEAARAVAAGADVVMLDNFSGRAAAEAAAGLRERFAGGNREFLIEISGGLTEGNIGEYARAGVDVISTSSIHQGVPHVDFSLKIVH